jgi:hypothetical protein
MVHAEQAIELLTSWVTRRLMKLIAKVDVVSLGRPDVPHSALAADRTRPIQTEVGLYEMKEHPELSE